MDVKEDFASGSRIVRGARQRVAGGQSSSVVRPVSQVVVDLREDMAFEKARKEVLSWIRPRAGRPLPKEAWQGVGFALDQIGAAPVEAVSVAKEGLRLWAGRLDYADKQTPQRVWTTEVALEGSGVRQLGVRLLCVSHGDDPVFERTVPGLVRQVAQNVDVRLSGWRVELEPKGVEDERGVDALLNLLTSAHRKVDVVVFSIPDSLTETEAIWQSARFVAHTAVGAIHVVVLGADASYRLSEQVGREFSVFGGAVRTYRPGFDPDEDDPYLHPLALAETVYGSEPETGRRFGGLLVDQALRRSVARHDAEQSLPSFRLIRRFSEEERRRGEREAAQDDSELLKVSIEENDDLRKQMERSEEEWEGLLEEVDSEKEAAEKENSRLKVQNFHLRERLASLESRVRDGVGEDEGALPDSLADLRDWAEERLAGSVEVVNRAVQRAKKSLFSDPMLVYRALLMLRDKYVPMKRGHPGATRELFDAACQELLVEESPSISENRAGEEGDEYYISYEGRRRLMDRHLKKGNSRDERHCLRIYFFWDSERKQVVVGSLPGHLDTRNT